MENQELLNAFSAHRLRGDPVPHDLALLLMHRDELEERTGIAFDPAPDWAPWNDTSYLSARDLADPDIRANVRAIAEVCKLVDFVVADDDGTYIGYWRGPAHLPLAQAPIVCFNNEGQFSFAGTANVAGALLLSQYPFEEVHAWFDSLGIGSLPSGEYDFLSVDVAPSPDELHKALYATYRAAESGAQPG